MEIQKVRKLVRIGAISLGLALMSFAETAFAQKAAKKVAEEEETSSGLVQNIADILGFFFSRLPGWIAAVILFVLSIGAAKVVRKIVETRISAKIDEEHQEILVLSGRISYVATLTVGITIALKIAGIDLTTILAAIAFGIGFALRDLIMNFIAGVMILISRHFTIGDFIKVGDRIGKVVEIQSRATILKAVDGTKVIVPNAEIFGNSVVSYTSNPMRRIIVPLYVAYGTDLEYALKISLSVLKNHPQIMKKPRPSVVIKDYGDSSIDLMGRFWVAKGTPWVKVRSEIIKLMDAAFTQAGIHVPYDVMHIETSSDIAEEERQEVENEKNSKEKMASEKLAKAAAKSGNGNGAGATITNTTTLSSANPVLAAVEVPVTEPEGAYADQTEIDENSIDNQG